MKTGLFNLIICFLISVIIAPLIIKWLYKLKFGQSILVYVEKHKQKSGTATMGGIIFIVSGLIGYLIFYGQNNVLATISILCFLFYGVLGFLDDFIKIKYKQNEGLKPYQCDKCEYSYTESNESIGTYHGCGCDNLKPLKRPPQSWCYVESEGGSNETR